MAPNAGLYTLVTNPGGTAHAGNTAGTTAAWLGILLPGGRDAAIEISDGRVQAFLDGRPVERGAFADYVAGYQRPLLKLAAKRRHGSDDTVILAGRWTAAAYDADPFMETMLVHIVDADGTVSTALYEDEVFDSDAVGAGPRVGIKLLPSDNVMESLIQMTEDEVGLLPRFRHADGKPWIDGILWVARGKCPMPVIVVEAVGRDAFEHAERQRVRTFTANERAERTAFVYCYQEFSDMLNASRELDCAPEALCRSYSAVKASILALSNEDDRFKAERGLWPLLKSSAFGEFRGQLVPRVHRPTTMTLREIITATSANGYWMQRKQIGAEAPDEPRYCHVDQDELQLPHYDKDLDYLGRESANWIWGNEYAGRWQKDGSGSLTRVLALAPAPQMPTT